MEWFLLYLVLKLDAVTTLFIIASVITTVLAILFWIIGASSVECSSPEFVASNYKRAIKFIYAAIPLIVLATLTPSTKQVVVIAGGVGVLEAARTERAQEIASKSVLVIENFLDSYLKEAEKPAK